MIETAIHPERILLLSGIGKTDALEQLIRCFVSRGDVKDEHLLRESIFYREKLMSTGLGLGIAVPHVRIDGVGDPIVAIGVSKTGIPDYQSIDGKTVHIVVMIVAGKEQHQKYIQLLAQFVTRLKEAGIIERLKSADSPKSIHSILLEK